VSLGGKLTYVFLYATTDLHQQRYGVIFVCYLSFLFMKMDLVVCGFVELLGLVDAFFVVFEIILIVCV
jgi:hypothetical protein